MSILNRFKAGKYKSTQASSFWLDDDFDVEFKSEAGIDYTKLAAAQRAIGNFVNIVTGKPIPVVFQSNDSSYTDGQTVTIGTKLDGKNFDPAVGLALHEGSHIAHTNFDLFKHTNGGPTSYLANTQFAKRCSDMITKPLWDADHRVIKDLLNWIEDRRIDYKIYTTAPGYRMYYEAMYDKYFNDKVIDKALIAGEKCQETMDDYMFHIINLTNPNRQLTSLKQLRAIWDIIDLKNIQRLQTTDDALTIACNVFTIIKQAEDDNKSNPQDLDNQPKQDDGDPTVPGNGGGGQGDGESNGGGGGESDGEENSDGDDDANSDNDSNADSRSNNTSKMSPNDLNKLAKAIEKQRDFLDSKSTKTGKLTKSQASTISAMREAGVESRSVSTSEDGKSNFVDTVVIKKLTPAIICSLPGLFNSNSNYFVNGQYNYDTLLASNPNDYKVRRIKPLQDAIMNGIVLGKQLGRKLQLRNADRNLKTTRLETGKIDRRLIAQLGYNNANVFHRIITDRFKNYFIHISIDASGSMSGHKFENAIASAVAVAQAASMTTGIRIQISLRGTNSLNGRNEKAVTIYAYDSALDKMSKIRNMFKYLDTFGCTPEGIAFKSIEKDIKADAKGDECIFVNYSDGAPTDISGCGYYYDGVAYTRRVITGFREIGINIISYFITEGNGYGAGSFKTMYGPDASFIKPTNMNEVSKTLNSKFLEISR
jgi:hypothetical protein